MSESANGRMSERTTTTDIRIVSRVGLITNSAFITSKDQYCYKTKTQTKIHGPSCCLVQR